jgi:hypothetical protein
VLGRKFIYQVVGSRNNVSSLVTLRHVEGIKATGDGSVKDWFVFLFEQHVLALDASGGILNKVICSPNKFTCLALFLCDHSIFEHELHCSVKRFMER